jgi:hypothetical protein
VRLVDFKNRRRRRSDSYTLLKWEGSYTLFPKHSKTSQFYTRKSTLIQKKSKKKIVGKHLSPNFNLDKPKVNRNDL